MKSLPHVLCVLALLLAGALHSRAAEASLIAACGNAAVAGADPWSTPCWGDGSGYGGYWGTWVDASTIIDPTVLMIGCAGGSLSPGDAEPWDATSCAGAGGVEEWEPASFWASSGLVAEAGGGAWMMLAAAGYTGGGGAGSSAPSGVPTSIDIFGGLDQNGALQLSAAVMGVWGLAWIFRQVRKVIR